MTRADADRSAHGSAGAFGGGILNEGRLLQHDLIEDNHAVATGPKGFARGGGIWNGSPFLLMGYVVRQRSVAKKGSEPGRAEEAHVSWRAKMHQAQGRGCEPRPTEALGTQWGQGSQWCSRLPAIYPRHKGRKGLWSL
jgi:hypothetical protein